MRPSKYLQNVLLGASALAFAGSRITPGGADSGPVLNAAVAFVSPQPASSTPAVKALEDSSSTLKRAAMTVAGVTKAALDRFTGSVHPLSHPKALEGAFRSYFAYRSAHPGEVRKPYLYFVDYGLPSTTPRGYVFDMDSLKVVDGPFTVAHGRGSSGSHYGVPTRFSNASGSNATSLGLYVTQTLYGFRGKSGGRSYSSIGMRLSGVSAGFNDNAFARGVVAHGAPYVTSDKAGRSEGCPAMEPTRAQRLLPKLAGGAMVFLFAPDERWMSADPWLASSGE